VERGVVGRAPAHDHGDGNLADELLEVEHRAVRRDVLGRDHRPLDHEDVEPGVDRHLVVVAHALRCESGRREDAGGLDLLDAVAHEV
jgi:hypothetical protein